MSGAADRALLSATPAWGRDWEWGLGPLCQAAAGDPEPDPSSELATACVCGQRSPPSLASPGCGHRGARGPQRVRLQQNRCGGCGCPGGMRVPARLRPPAPGAGAGAPSDPAWGSLLGSWVRGPGPPLTRGARAEKEGLSSAAAAPRRKGPAFSGMFSVHFLMPFPLCELQVSPGRCLCEGHLGEQSSTRCARWGVLAPELRWRGRRTHWLGVP